MIIVMKEKADPDDVQKVIAKLTEMDFDIHRSTGVNQTVLGVMGDNRKVDIHILELMPGVRKVTRISEPFKFSSRAFSPNNTLIETKNITIGKTPVVIAGPATIENKEQIEQLAKMLKDSGASALRVPLGVDQKNREEKLQLLHKAANNNNLLSISNVTNTGHIAMAEKYLDIVEVAASDMYNYDLLRALGNIKNPILLKRAAAATIEELLVSADQIIANGNSQVILCECGIRTFEKYTSLTLDLSAIPIVQELSHLPILVDPSVALGIRHRIPPLALAAKAAGASGVILEVSSANSASSLFSTDFQKLVAQFLNISQREHQCLK